MGVIPMFNDFSVKSFKGEYFVKYCSWKTTLVDHLEEGDVVIIDRRISELYPDIISAVGNNFIKHIEATEDSKSYESIGGILEELISEGFSNNNKLVAIGGGITQDITSFIASIYKRGVDWTFFPTNLLTQCDSCIGSKTSVNLGPYKNQLGGFHPPRCIFIDFKFCETLQEIDISSGLGEMIHYFLVEGCEDIESLLIEVQEAKTNNKILAELVQRSLKIKRSMVEIDEFDTGPRRVFNYGHTFGHALEAASNFSVPHGIAVAYGIDLANIISSKKEFIDIELRNSVRPILESVWQCCPIPFFDIDNYFNALMKDKKNIDGKLQAILTRGLGKMSQEPVNLNEEIRKTITEFFNLKLYDREL